MNLPPHKCGLYLVHNVHLDYYETLAQWFEDDENTKCVQWATETSKQRCLDTGEYWGLQWYPETPIGFFFVGGATLDEVLVAANQLAILDAQRRSDERSKA